MKTYKVLIFGLFMLPLVFACKGITESIRDTFNDRAKDEKETTVPEDDANMSLGTDEIVSQKSTSQASATEPDFLRDTVALEKAEQALRNLPQFNGKQIRLYNDVHFYDDGRVMLNLQHPENPEYIDAYTYDDGLWGEPKPVQISVRTDLKSKLFELDKMKFKTVATIVKNFNEKAASIEGAKAASHVYGIVWDGQFMWYPRTIDGSRQRYAIDFNLDGSVKLYKRE